jgi:hypothetical protein
VARQAHAVLDPSKAVVFSDAPDYDQHWLDVLMASAECWPIPRLLGVTRLLSSECEPLRGTNHETPQTSAWNHENGRICNRIPAVLILTCHTSPGHGRWRFGASRCQRRRSIERHCGE